MSHLPLPVPLFKINPAHTGIVIWMLAFSLIGFSAAQDAINFKPILYWKTAPNDPIAKLQKKISNGTVQLRFNGSNGYLESVLKALKVPINSQVLVFSKTSSQLRMISPQTPRAIYFNDDVYVGWIPGAELLELSSVDPKQGAMFYTLKQVQAETTVFQRDNGNCLVCHNSPRTHGVPGHLLRSVYSSNHGQPYYGMGTFTTTQASPFSERWGGWYVTGSHGSLRHMGNSTLTKNNDELVLDQGANQVDVSSRFRVSQYLSKHSDLVALMILGHQTEMHNYITLANYQTRQALHQNEFMNRALERAPDFVSESTDRRINQAVEKLLQHMLFVDEFPLTEKLSGTSGFANSFQVKGRQDRLGRSLRELDLKNRLFKYPCSYLIHSDAFSQLPSTARNRLYRRLWTILINKDPHYAEISREDRKAVLDILRDTKPDLPAYWKQDSPESQNARSRSLNRQ